MTGGVNIEERLETMALRLERVERVNRLLKVWGSIAVAALVAAGPFASNVMAKAKKAPKAVTASAFNLESNGKIVATLGVFNVGNGLQPDLAFFDSSGKLVVAMGIVGTGLGAGMSVYDNNAAIPGGTGIPRVEVGVTPGANEEGIATYTAAGLVQSSVGSAEDGTFSGGLFYDASGSLRAGIEYDPAASINFSGVFSQDGSGHNLSSLGSAIAASTPLDEEANESAMILSDTSLPRVFEFQNSTNEGGVNYDPGDFPTVESGWGNP